MDTLAEAKQLFLDALALHERGELEQAEDLYLRALALAPDRPSVMNNLAAVLVERRKYTEAEALCHKLLGMNGSDEMALLNLGTCQLRQGAPAAALLTYEKALGVKPDFAEAHNNRGSALLELKRPQEALESFDRALAADPQHAEALTNRGSALMDLARTDEALASYGRALALRPDYLEAHYNLGSALLELNRPAEALTSFDRALALAPGHVEVLNNRGHALLRLGRAEEALAGLDSALAMQPGHPGVLENRGDALLALQRREEVVENYERLLRAHPGRDYVRGHLLRARLLCCDWTDHDASVQDIAQEVRAGRRAVAPFDFLVVSDSPADQLRCAQTFITDKYPVVEPLWRGERYRHERIRVAYLSGDLRNHAVAYLVAGLFEAHDRTRFETTALSFGPAGNDEMRARLVPAFDRFVEVGGRSDREVAQLLRELEIDIAVDLQGHTQGSRPAILARRAAPVQVNYIGYPGTMGAVYMDYIIADRNVIPPEHQRFFSEKVVYLPDCYQVNDDRRRIADRSPSRVEAGLPDQGFVFCCFNNSHKINPGVFEIWMRLLGEVDGSVLWLLEDSATAARQLRREAQRRGVAPGRLVFAPRAKMEEHLARQRLADLFLDTLPYNAHVTASDALWAGLPVLTRRGQAFAGRVAASLLEAVGLPELITDSREAYESTALTLAREPGRLAAIKVKLARNRATAPLFDTDRSRRHIEAAYVTMWERTQRGEPPAGFAIPADA
jgi:protein O-GlcNAc transferase